MYSKQCDELVSSAMEVMHKVEIGLLRMCPLFIVKFFDFRSSLLSVV